MFATTAGEQPAAPALKSWIRLVNNIEEWAWIMEDPWHEV